IRVSNIEILDITNPSGNKVLLRANGDLKKLKVGDTVKVGPIPYSRLVIEGVIIHIDEDRKELVIDVTRMISIPKVQVRSIISRKLIALKPDMTLRDASQILYKEGIRGAPVLSDDGRTLGILTTADIIKAFFEGNFEAKVSDYMKTNVITINDDDDILTAIRKMLIYNVGRLLVLERNQKVIGIVTRTDILKTIAGLEELITT
ncbi:MAG: CBS domain-containing protein, partial [Sulfolobaceae archaeon]